MVLEAPKILYLAPTAGVRDRIVSFAQHARAWVRVTTLDDQEITDDFEPDPRTGFGVGLYPRYTLTFPEGLMLEIVANLFGPAFRGTFRVYRSLQPNGEGADEIRQMWPDRPAIDTHCKYCGREMEGTNLHEYRCPDSPGGGRGHTTGGREGS